MAICFLRHQLLVLVRADQPWPSQVIEVSIVIPELEVVLTLPLEASDFVEDSQVCGTVINREVLRNFMEQFQLILGQARGRVAEKLIKVENPLSLDRGCTTTSQDALFIDSLVNL